MKRLEDTGPGLLERTLQMTNALKNVTTEANLCRINATLDVESHLKDGIKAFLLSFFTFLFCSNLILGFWLLAFGLGIMFHDHGLSLPGMSL